MVEIEPICQSSAPKTLLAVRHTHIELVVGVNLITKKEEEEKTSFFNPEVFARGPSEKKKFSS